MSLRHAVKVSSNGNWPPAPEGYFWLRPVDIVERTDLYVRDGAIGSVQVGDVGCKVGCPTIYQDGTFCHYARPVSKIGSLQPSEPLTNAQHKRLEKCTEDLYFLLDLIDSCGFIAGTSYQRRFREIRDEILNGRKKP